MHLYCDGTKQTIKRKQVRCITSHTYMIESFRVKLFLFRFSNEILFHKWATARVQKADFMTCIECPVKSILWSVYMEGPHCVLLSPTDSLQW